MNRGKSCCGSDAEESSGKDCCAERRRPEAVGTCKHCKTKVLVGKVESKPKSQQAKANRRVVVSMLALKCQGADSVFTQLPSMLPSVRPEAICVAYLETCHWPFSKPLTSVAREPDTPPPKEHFL